MCHRHQAQTESAVVSFCMPSCLCSVITGLFLKLPVHFQATLSPSSFGTTSGFLGITDGRVVPRRGRSIWNTLYGLRSLFVKEER